MIKLFNLDNHIIDTGCFSHHLHDQGVKKFEIEFSKYVGAEYACSINSATNAIFLSLLNKNSIIKVPSAIPPVVLNAIITSGNKIEFTDNIEWVGGSYVLHELEDYKIIDSAQKVEKGQFAKEAEDKDLMIFSFYPTKPVGSYDGGIIVSNDKDKIDWFRAAVMNGCKNESNSWDRTVLFPGWKMYMNSIQALVASKSLKNLEKKNTQLNNVRSFYNKELGLNNKSLHLYRVNVKDNKKVKKELYDKGIQCGIHYEAAHRNPVYASSSVYTSQRLKDSGLVLSGDPLIKSTRESHSTLSIPFNEKLKQEDLDYILKNIKSYL